MILDDIHIDPEMEEFDRALGTPTSQKIIKLLSCWNSLSSKELISKTKMSESQIYITLQNLEKCGIVQKKARGIYSFDDSPFAQALYHTYRMKLEEIVGSAIYRFRKRMEKIPLNQMLEEFKELVILWDPILKDKFKFQMSSIAENIIDIQSDQARTTKQKSNKN